MSDANHFTEQQVRGALVARVELFKRLTGTPKSNISKAAVNDPAFISRVEKGMNFTIANYDRVMTWLDRHWPEEGQTLMQPSPDRAA